MDPVNGVESWRQVMVHSLSQLRQSFTEFLPSLVAAATILLVGWTVSRLVAFVAERALHRFGLDRGADRTRVTESLRQAGVAKPPSAIIARLLFWTLMLTFLLSAAEALRLTAVATTLDRLVAYLPHVVAALLIVISGLLVGGFVRNVVLSGATFLNVAQARFVGGLANVGIVVLVAVLALEQLGVRTEVLAPVVTAVVATIGLTGGIGFALGARGIVAHILAGHFLRRSLVPGQSVEVRGERGAVEEVGAVETLFRRDDRVWSVPNSQLLEEVVVR